jgi:hypothetical protein
MSSKRFDQAMESIQSPGFKDLPLLVRADTFKELKGGGLLNKEIAALAKKTPQHVEQLLILATAEAGVRRLIAREQVTYAMVIEAVRDERRGGQNALVALNRMVANAREAGRSRAMRRDLETVKLPNRRALIGMLKELSPLRTLIATQLEDTSNRGELSVTISQDHARVLVSLLDVVSAGKRSSKKVKASARETRG